MFVPSGRQFFGVVLLIFAGFVVAASPHVAAGIRAQKAVLQATNFELLDENKRVVATLAVIDGDAQLTMFGKSRDNVDGCVVIGTNESGGYLRLRSLKGRSEMALFFDRDNKPRSVGMTGVGSERGANIDWAQP